MKRAGFNAKTQPVVAGILSIFEEDRPPLTVRMVYYRLSTKLGLVPFSKKGYDQTCRVTLRMRQLGLLPWSWFADRTRSVEVVDGWNGLGDFLDTVRDAYRRDLWDSQPVRVEIWLEKDAESGFFKAALGPYRVGLYTIRGFSSKTFVYEAAQSIKQQHKPTHIYYFGDFDPSGVAIEEDVRSSLGLFGANLASFQRVAVTIEQADKLGLRTMEAKRTDSRAKKYVAKYGTRTVELEALEPETLRQLIVECVDKHIDHDAWSRLLRTERIEQETIQSLTLGVSP